MFHDGVPAALPQPVKVRHLNKASCSHLWAPDASIQEWEVSQPTLETILVLLD